MINIVSVLFNRNTENENALSDLRSSVAGFSVLTAVILKKTDTGISRYDGFNVDKTDDSWSTGGLIGGIVEIIDGPLGALLGPELGPLMGSASIDDKTIVETINNNLALNQSALLLIVEEEENGLLNQYLNERGAHTIIREPAVTVEFQVLHAQEVEAELREEAITKLQENRKHKLNERVEDSISTMEERFRNWLKK